MFGNDGIRVFSSDDIRVFGNDDIRVFGNDGIRVFGNDSIGVFTCNIRVLVCRFITKHQCFLCVFFFFFFKFFNQSNLKKTTNNRKSLCHRPVKDYSHSQALQGPAAAVYEAGRND